MSHTQKSFTVRPASLDDAEAIANVVNACSIEQTGKSQVKGQQIRSGLQMCGLNLETDVLVAVGPGGQLVAYANVQDDAPHKLIFAQAQVHPRYRGMGIGATLCQRVEGRARRSISDAPAGARVALLQKQLSANAAARELLPGQGYQVVRHNFRMLIEMQGPPPQPVVPEGIVIRPFIRDQEARALIRAMREAFRDNWGNVERPFEVDYERWMHILDRDHDCDPSPFWFVALDGEEIAGMAMSRLKLAEDPEMAWVYIVGVRPSWRRRGIALALLLHSFGALYRWGKRKVSLEVDAQSTTGATRLYEKAGMRVERQYDFFEKELRPGKD